MDFSLNQFLGEMSRVAVINSKAGTLYRMMKQAAEQSTNPTFRFLSAWLALNLKDYESCIDQCDRIDYPLAPIYTIHGQALLETNRPKEAIEILEISVELDAGDMFAWFQLAKAYFVIDQFENAWTCLNTCLQQDRSNIEVILMISFIATKAPFREDWLRFASNLLNGQMGQYSDNLTIIKQGLLVATRLNHHESARVLIHHANWRTLKNQPDFLSFLAEILKQFHELEWHDLTINFIDQVEMTQSVN
jgi:tetratricopeptide (TPR) repeat protein